MFRLSDPEVLRTVLEELSTGVYIVDPERRILFWNRGAEKISGHLSQDVIGRCCGETILAHCDESSDSLCGEGCPILEAVRDGRRRRSDVYLRHRAGHCVAVHMETIPVRDQQGTIVAVAGMFFQRRYSPQPDSRLGPFTAVDERTGLPDAEMGRSQLLQALEEYVQQGISFCLLRLHVNELSDMRTTRGHDAADAILRVVVRTLTNVLRPTDILTEWVDGDFLVIARNCQSNATGKIVRRMEKIVSRSGISWWGDQLSVTLSVGATAVMPGDTADSILERADQALEKTIGNGSSCTDGPFDLKNQIQ
jgi:diguanylate cyclase (GGDEF)-like protein/PAS domain S-box-containing protein